MYFPDMGTESMMASGEEIRAIGWLHRDHLFATGEAPHDFVGRLCDFAKCWGDSSNALEWGAAGGVHTCEFCGKCHMSGNFGVPGGELLFVAPEMIVHYVTEHSYLPPAEFIGAVLASPLPGTREYEVAVAKFLRLQRTRQQILQEQGRGWQT